MLQTNFGTRGKKAAKQQIFGNCPSLRRILPPLSASGEKAKDLPFVKTPLMEYIQSAYTSKSRGNSHVIFAAASVGKTSACRAIMQLVTTGRNIQALMITGAQKGVPYLAHMAKALNIEKGEDVLVDLIDGMRTVSPEPASLLILDEMNDASADDCNITLVDALMRFIYDQHQGIHLMVVTQNPQVADRLSKLNSWQKIAPLEGLTKPTRREVRNKEAPVPGLEEDINWDPANVAWSLINLTKFIDTRFQDHGFEKNQDGVITWLRQGMTPTEAEQQAEELLEKEMTRKEKEEKREVDFLSATI